MQSSFSRISRAFFKSSFALIVSQKNISTMQSASINPAKVFGAIFEDVDLPARVRDHLTKVYNTLGLTLFAAFVGAILHMMFNIGGTLTSLLAVGTMFYIATNRLSLQPQMRLASVAAFGLFKGMSLGPLLQHVMHIDPTIIVTAFLGTALVFGCFSVMAMYSKRRQHLYLGGLLSSAISFLFLLSVIGMFYNSSLIRSANLYLGLIVFCGYVLYDTQVIIEKVHNGSDDYMWHAVELFVDFVAIFVRLVIMLLDNANKQEDKKKNKRGVR